MKIAVVGAGIAGICTAFELAVDGHNVTVYDKSSAACEESSFAINGLIAPSLQLPFSASSDKKNSLSRWLHTGRSLTRTPWRSLRDMKSVWQWTQAQPPELRAEQVSNSRQLGLYSTERLRYLIEHQQLEIESSEGHLILVRTLPALKSMQKTLEALKALDIAVQVMTPEEARTREPALHQEAPFHAALWLPGDGVVNCRQFALELKTQSQRLGVTYHFGATVQDLSTHPSPTLSVQHPDRNEHLKFDHVVLCTNHLPRQWMGKAAQQFPMFELHSYVLSVAIREPLNAPRSALYDLQDGVLINRLGNRIRVSAGAEIGAKPAIKDPQAVASLYSALSRYFPGSANYGNGAQVWHGTRHMVADGLPLIGPSGLAQVSLNLGHGACGWTWACGAARLVADQIAGQTTAIPDAAVRPTRFAHRK